MPGGDKPRPPHCALDSVVTSDHDEEAFRRRLWHSYRVVVANIDDDRLTVDQRNGLKSIGHTLYDEDHHG